LCSCYVPLCSRYVPLCSRYVPLCSRYVPLCSRYVPFQCLNKFILVISCLPHVIYRTIYIRCSFGFRASHCVSVDNVRGKAITCLFEGVSLSFRVTFPHVYTGDHVVTVVMCKTPCHYPLCT